jgi:hypothetical protein
MVPAEPHALALSADASALYTGNFSTNTLSLFFVDRETGALRPHVTIPTMNGPWKMALMRVR